MVQILIGHHTRDFFRRISPVQLYHLFPAPHRLMISPSDNDRHLVIWILIGHRTRDLFSRISPVQLYHLPPDPPRLVIYP